MKDLKWFFVVVCLVSLGAYLAPGANAGEWDQKTMLTFNEPVELPGIVLPAGTYVFRLVNSPVDRNIVQVFSQNEQKLYATINTIPDYREVTTENTKIVFEERSGGAPHSLKEWFFPDRRYGHEFVYSKREPFQLAKSDENANPPAEFGQPQSAEFQSGGNEPDTATAHPEEGMQSEESSYMNLLHQQQTEPRELAKTDDSESANGPAESGGMSYLEALHQKQTEETQGQQIADQSAGMRELPRTASHLPLVFVSGFFLVAVSFGLRLYSRRTG